jgi:NTE family protein
MAGNGAVVGLREKLPAVLRNSPEAKLLGGSIGQRTPGAFQDFSRLGMEEHWRAGYRDARRTLRHPEVLERPTNHEGKRAARSSRGRRSQTSRAQS